MCARLSVAAPSARFDRALMLATVGLSLPKPCVPLIALKFDIYLICVSVTTRGSTPPGGRVCRLRPRRYPREVGASRKNPAGAERVSGDHNPLKIIIFCRREVCASSGDPPQPRCPSVHSVFRHRDFSATLSENQMRPHVRPLLAIYIYCLLINITSFPVTMREALGCDLWMRTG